jgi:hypothetical protein
MRLNQQASKTRPCKKVLEGAKMSQGSKICDLIQELLSIDSNHLNVSQIELPPSSAPWGMMDGVWTGGNTSSKVVFPSHS